MPNIEFRPTPCFPSVDVHVFVDGERWGSVRRAHHDDHYYADAALRERCRFTTAEWRWLDTARWHIADRIERIVTGQRLVRYGNPSHAYDPAYECPCEPCRDAEDARMEAAIA